MCAKKRGICFVMICILIASLLAACGSNQSSQENTMDTGTTEVSNNEGGSSESNEKLSFPLKEKTPLSVFVRFGTEVDDYETNDYTLWLEEQTNIDFDFITASKDDEVEKLNILLATGSYPEVLLTSKLNYSQQALYGSQGIILPLNDLIEKYGENTKKVFEAYPTAKTLTTAADGNIYNLPLVNDCYHCKSAQKVWIYQPWLEEAGLDLPTTTEEFKEVLQVFADRGEDVIPFIGCDQGWKSQVYSFIMNAFVYYSHDQEGLFLKDGKVAASYAQDGWKEGLKYLQQLRKDGLLATESFTIDRNGVKQIANNPDKVILGAFPYGYQQGIVSGATDRWLEYTAVPPLKGPNGVQFTEYMPYRNDFLPGFSITNKCENPEAAMLLADFFYTEESTHRAIIGRKGIDWDYTNEGIGINGEPARHDILIPLAKQDANNRWGQISNSFRSEDIRLTLKAKSDKDMEVILYNETANKYVDHRPGLDVILPPLPFTDQQSAELVPYQNTIESFYKEKIAYFVLGDMDIDAEWEGYIQQLEQMGLNKMLEIYQESFDANFAK
ncbi:extracellular solute-binding protein [Vallitalea okinawensis]|uniref:extracellular solute-binding protein n=1 Tax=Vallitalea okinawensis TaxID=2078660 RepID=UPI000CFBB18A|nr:extracellular solute-binding protein [Vallitalea okinawensis]